MRKGGNLLALRKVGVIFTAEGYSQYMGELKQVSQEMRTMATQSKLAVAQLGNNASTTDTYSTKMKSMGAEIQVSSQRTKMLSDLQKTLGAEQKRLPDMIEKSTQKYKESNETTKELRKSYTALAKAKGEDAEETLAAEKAYKSSLRETNNLKKEMKELEVVYNQNSKQLEKLPNDLAKAELATQRLTNAQQKMHTEYRNQGGWLADTAKGWQDFGSKVTNVGDQISKTGDYLTTRVTLPIIATGGMALKAAMDWETGFAGVMKTNDEVVDSTGKVIYGYEQLENELRNLTSTVPVAHSDLAGIAENAGQLGIATQDVVGFTDVIAKLGHTTNLSYDEASTALAQFLNVTGSGTGTVSNLASSIVALGNNTAATEKDILMMSQRWATTGAMIGLSDDQITAMSATLISMGVNVEAGGSAMQRFGQKVNSYVLDAGMDLEILAETAGMTSSEFASAWENEPVSALEAFLEGLDGVVKEGGNANALLKDLGITSVQEVNALLALAGGHEQLATALGLSADAYKENTALGDEFAVFAETTAAKVQVFKNRVNDLMIDFGGPLADAMTSALTAAEPWIEKLAEMAKGFSEMDEAGQRNILMWVGIVAAAGPVLSIFGRITSASGKVITGVGDAIKLIGKWTTPKAVGETATELGKIPGAAGKAGGSAALFSNPWVIAGSVITGVVAGIGVSLYNEARAPHKAHQESVKETEGKYQEWFDAVVAGNGTISELNAQGVAGAEEMAGAYEQATQRIMEANREVQDAMDMQFGEKSWQDYFQQPSLEVNWKESETGQGPKFILTDLQKTLVDTGQISQTEMSRISESYNQAGVMLSSVMSEMSASKFNNEKVTVEWAGAQIKAIKEVATSTVENLNTVKEARISEIESQRELGLVSETEARGLIAKEQQLTEERIQLVNESQSRIHAIMKDASDTNRKLNSEEVTTMMFDIMQLAEITGQSFTSMGDASKILGENLEALTGPAALGFLEGMGIIDKQTAINIASMENMEEKTKALRDILIEYGLLDPDTKEFDLDTSDIDVALLSIEELATAWNDLSFDEKRAQVETRGKEEIEDLMERLGVDWESLSPSQKEYYAQAVGGEALENVLYLTGEWNRQTDPKTKYAVLETQIDNEALLAAIEMRDLWNSADFMSLAMEIDTNAPDAEAKLVNLINYFAAQNGQPPLQMETDVLTDDAQADLAALIAAYTGAPVEDVLEFLISTNADETEAQIGAATEAHEEAGGVGTAEMDTSTNAPDTTGKLVTTGTTLSNLNGQSATVAVHLSDNASYAIQRISEQLSGLNGRTATAYVTTMSTTATFAEGGHITPFATGGNVQWGGMFANGGNVPKGFAGIVGEAGPEIFTVTNRGVSITPLNSKEKMRGVQGAVADEVSKQLNGKGSGETINLSINIDRPTVSKEQDINKLANRVASEVSHILAKKTNRKMGGHAYGTG